MRGICLNLNSDDFGIVYLSVMHLEALPGSSLAPEFLIRVDVLRKHGDIRALIPLARPDSLTTDTTCPVKLILYRAE